MKKFTLKILSFVALIVIVFYGLCFVALYTGPSAFKNHYQQGVIYQYRAIERAQGKKLVTIGGSNVAFQVDSDLMTELVGIPSYNYGVHAAMGFTYMFDTLEPLLNEGDVVIFPYNQFMAGQDYGYELIEITLEGQTDLLNPFVKDHFFDVLKSVPSFLHKKVYQTTIARVMEKLKGKVTTSNDPYTALSFDSQTGNMIFDRPTYTSLEEISVDIRLTPDAYRESEVSFTKAFVERCRARGIEVYFTFPSIYRASIPQTDDEILVYDEAMKELHSFATFLPNIGTTTVSYGAEDYYNGAMHLNNAGAKKYTTTLASSIKEILN